MMPRLWSFLIALATVLSLAMAGAPRMCVGDGHGGACNANACACVASCSCQAAHGLERQLAESQGHMCHGGHAPAAASCHHQGLPHFALPPHRWLSVPVAQLDPTAFLASRPERTSRLTGRFGERAIAPPEKPPRLV